MERSELYGIGLRYKVRYLDPNDNERSKSFADKQKKRAEDLFIGVESDKREDKYIGPASLIDDVPATGRELTKRPVSEPRHAVDPAQQARKALYPAFETKKLGQIKTSTIRDWVGSMDERKLSDNYQAVLFNTVSGVMNSAVDDRRIRENSCHAKTVRRPVASSPPVVVWPEERIQAVRSGSCGSVQDRRSARFRLRAAAERDSGLLARRCRPDRDDCADSSTDQDGQGRDDVRAAQAEQGVDYPAVCRHAGGDRRPRGQVPVRGRRAAMAAR